MTSDVGELILFADSRKVGDTFIFEPVAAEKNLGRLLVAMEMDNKGGIGRQLIDTIVNALQKEYYRDPTRGQLVSLEAALHQANLVLYEAAEQGIKEWMGSLHAAVGALAGKTLHVSGAGQGVVVLSRMGTLTEVSAGLAHSPITDPLRTFSQVASGVVGIRDVLFLGTSGLPHVFKNEDLTRMVAGESAGVVAGRLKQLYEDRRNRLNVAMLIVSLLAEEENRSQPASLAEPSRPAVAAPTYLTPRKPLNIKKSWLKRMVVLLGRVMVVGARKLREAAWPRLKQGGRKVVKFTAKTGPVVIAVPKKIRWRRAVIGFNGLPKSSRLFAILVVVLTMALVASLTLLQRKRSADAEFAQASEFLHEARTKKEAAETALIYDNRDQARTLLGEADNLAQRIDDIGLYEEQVAELRGEVRGVQDRLEKVTRAQGAQVSEIGDFAGPLGAQAMNLFYLQGSLYAFNPRDNTIARMTETGETTIVSRTSQNIGFFTVAAEHEADKSLVLMTDSPGAALYDAVTEIVQKQEISFPQPEADVKAVATFGNRIYLYDKQAQEIYGFSKTLRGYSGGAPWITDADFPKNDIVSIGVDGYIYTLHSDGTVRKLLKGAPVEFELEQLERPVAGDARLHITENLNHLYIFDPANKRVVIYDTVGNLNRQIFFGEEAQPRDIAVAPDEKTLYILDGTKVKALALSF